MEKTTRNHPQNIETTNLNAAPEATAEVLYQRLGDKWYAFSLIGDDVYVGEIEAQEIQRIRENKANIRDS